MRISSLSKSKSSKNRSDKVSRLRKCAFHFIIVSSESEFILGNIILRAVNNDSSPRRQIFVASNRKLFSVDNCDRWKHDSEDIDVNDKSRCSICFNCDNGTVEMSDTL